MTMKEAVEVIKTAQSQVEWDYPMDYAAAFDLAIKALEAHDATDTNVGSTISRQAAIDALEKVATLFPWKVPGNRDSYDRYNEAWNDAIGRAEIEIEELPSVQPEIIHCRDCKKWMAAVESEEHG